MPQPERRSFQSRSRDVMKGQFKHFYHMKWGQIREMDASKDMWILYNLFSSWLEEQRNACIPSQTEKNGNIAMSRSLPSLGEFCAIHDEAAEEMVWDTFHRQPDWDQKTVTPTTPSLTEPSPTARGGPGTKNEGEEASR